MESYNIHEAKTHFSKLIGRVERRRDSDRPRWPGGGAAGCRKEAAAEAGPAQGKDQDQEGLLRPPARRPAVRIQR